MRGVWAAAWLVAANAALPGGAAAQATAGPAKAGKAAEKAAKPGATGSATPGATSDQQVVLYKVGQTGSLFSFDYGPPSSPATTLLGLSTDATHPTTTLSDLVTSLPTLVGSDAGQSFAFDLPAARLYEPWYKSSFDRYTSDPDGLGGKLYRIGYRTRLGIAALNGNDGGGDAAKVVRSRLAFGLSTTLLDSADPLAVQNNKGGLLLRDCLTPIVPLAQPILDKYAKSAGDAQTEAANAILKISTLESHYLHSVEADADPAKRHFSAGDRAGALKLLGASPDAVAAASEPKTAKAGADNKPAGDRPATDKRTDEKKAKDIAALKVEMKADYDDAEKAKAPAYVLSFMKHTLDRLDALDPSAPSAATSDVAAGSPTGSSTSPAPHSASAGYGNRGTALRIAEAATQGSTPLPATAAMPEPEGAPTDIYKRDKQIFLALNAAEADAQAKSTTAFAQTPQAMAADFEKAHVTDRVNTCNAIATRTARFNPSLAIGGGVLAQGAGGKLQDLQGDGQVTWLAYRHPLHVFFDPLYDKSSPAPLPTQAIMLALSGRASWNERLATQDKVTKEFRADTWNAWVGLEWLFPSYRLSGQYGWLQVNAREAIGKTFEKSGERYQVGGQFQLPGHAGWWMSINYGNAYGTVGELKANTALITLSYAPPGAPDITRPPTTAGAP